MKHRFVVLRKHVVIPPLNSRRHHAPTWSKSLRGCSWPARRNWWGKWWLHGELSALWNPGEKKHWGQREMFKRLNEETVWSLIDWTVKIGHWSTACFPIDWWWIDQWLTLCTYRIIWSHSHETKLKPYTKAIPQNRGWLQHSGSPVKVQKAVVLVEQVSSFHLCFGSSGKRRAGTEVAARRSARLHKSVRPEE